ncbi:mechanosensitive ion channel family protein [Nordella sp. HKS 07]|uniref:mechanosensitive ion channel family protein n=1 Tax=Nordella sp. HKS 07 TaxID=2712222 RepID=UPI0013E0F6D5|nr:mechanosensitive ion channel family protein [Nordella sp. HKS 07]QIG52218.1 mechanosensitive ion channel family protein [Nordella sp. HKS 07]
MTGKASSFVVKLFLILLCWALPGTAGQAQTTDPGITLIVPSGQDSAQVEAIIKSLKDGSRPVTIRVESGKVAAEPEAHSSIAVTRDGLYAKLIALRDKFGDGVEQGFRGIGKLGSVPEKFSTAWNANAPGFSPLFLLIVIGFVMAAAYFVPLRWRRNLVTPPAARESDLGVRFLWRAKVLLIDLLALAAMAAAGLLAVRFLLPHPDFARAFAHSIIRFALIVGLYLAVGRFLLAADNTGAPLLPVLKADWHRRNLLIYAVCVALIIESINLLDQVNADLDAVIGCLFITSTLTAGFALWWVWSARHDVRQAIRHANPEGWGRRVVAAIFPAMNIIGVLMVWSAARVSAGAPEESDWSTAASIMLLLIAISPILGFGVPALVDAAMVKRHDDEPASPVRAASRSVVRAIASAGSWIAVIYAVIYIWTVYVAGNDPQSALARMSILAQAGIAFLVGCTIWVFFRSYFDSYAPRAPGAPHLAGADDDVGSMGQGRLATVLPLIRDIVLGGIVALTALVILSAIGVNIGPLLAGFGVLGLAVSFGSQTLIKDIVSGVFFMADDAFRVGEYIETGKQKGTVEKIHLRSVRLRHQNGQIHTVPFGQLDAVTNYSRDWATVKFEIRLDRDADIEKARKVIKKVGLAMQEDPELGPDLIAPLKMQGIQDITDSAVVVRLKFTAKPKNPSLLQRDALKRVYRSLQEAGVPLASNAVTVRSPTSTLAGAAVSAAMAPPAVDPRAAE